MPASQPASQPDSQTASQPAAQSPLPPSVTHRLLRHALSQRPLRPLCPAALRGKLRLQLLQPGAQMLGLALGNPRRLPARRRSAWVSGAGRLCQWGGAAVSVGPPAAAAAAAAVHAVGAAAAPPRGLRPADRHPAARAGSHGTTHRARVNERLAAVPRAAAVVERVVAGARHDAASRGGLARHPLAHRLQARGALRQAAERLRHLLLTRRARNALGTATQCTRRNDSPPSPPPRPPPPPRPCRRRRRPRRRERAAPRATRRAPAPSWPPAGRRSPPSAAPAPPPPRPPPWDAARLPVRCHRPGGAGASAPPRGRRLHRRPAPPGLLSSAAAPGAAWRAACRSARAAAP
jgi:hypothetical protein